MKKTISIIITLVMLLAIIPLVNGNYGDLYQFGDGYYDEGVSPKVLTLNLQYIVVAYSSYSNGGGVVKIGNITDNSIAYGDGYVFCDGNYFTIYQISLARLGNNSFVLAYTYGDMDYNYASVRVCTVSGTEITIGDETTFDYPVRSYAIAVSAFNSSCFIIAYAGTEYETPTASRVVTVSGTDMNLGEEFMFSSIDVQTIYTGMGSTITDGSHFVLAYQSSPGPYNGYCVVGEVSDYNITYGSETAFYTDSWAVSIGIDTLDSSNVAICFNDWNGYASVIVGTISNTSISYGDKFNTDIDGYPSISVYDDNNFVLSMHDSSNDNNGKTIQGFFDGINITFSNEQTFYAGNVPYFTSVDFLSPSYVVVFNEKDGYTGQSVILEYLFPNYSPQLNNEYPGNNSRYILPQTNIGINITDTENDTVNVSFYNIGTYYNFSYNWSDDFDSYLNGQFLDGTPDDGGWKGFNNNSGYGTYVTDEYLSSSPNSVNISGSTDLLHELSTRNLGNYTLKMKQYVPNGSTNSFVKILSQYQDNDTDKCAVQLRTRKNGTWIEATAHAGWSKREFFTSIVYDNKMWILGGYDGGNYFNDTWYSTDGANWTQATAHAGWSERHALNSVVYDNKMWVIGGVKSNYLNDTWYSTDGANWTLATGTANWSARYSFSSVVFDNKMWVLGGADDTGYLNDAWYSTDGANWTRATAHAGWSKRAYHTSVAFDNKMWVIGGSGSGDLLNDIWYSTDGINWTEATSNAGWSGRRSFTTVVYDNKMWVIGGRGESPTYRNDFWYSTDGINWTEQISLTRVYHTSVVYDGKMWLMGGEDGFSYFNDVWYSYGESVDLIESEYDSVYVPLIKDTWVEIRIEINLDSDWLGIYYNDILLIEKPWTNGIENNGDGILSIQALELFANGATVYYDNISLTGAGTTRDITLTASIMVNNTINGTTAEIYLPDYILIPHNSNYQWYVTANDSYNVNTSGVFNFDTCKAYDLNGDSTVNYLDVSALVSHYGQSGTPGWIPEDINDDGDVNYLDVSALVSHYGESY